MGAGRVEKVTLKPVGIHATFIRIPINQLNVTRRNALYFVSLLVLKFHRELEAA